ncbi:flagellar hook-associated protein 3 [Spirochaeta africana]|uniref:Flagellar hook-associated protein 3 n=1 Tax=Spirochaeta africana (strain ATCC 700263 / DSM 8902 / Z-7692) TaxID=889378 RepID=H9UH96_SPIAZ|nr:flagellar hook-associated protein 3 [Spirochaeta africana]AFG36889.1 flagellar hook-associated protein 3 [Spirochaeta africana DSM 8902]
MNRVSSNLGNNNMIFHMRNRELEMSNKQNQMASQQRIQQLRDDPVAAAHSTRLQSYQTRLQRYEKNSHSALDAHRYTEGQLRHGVEVFQRVRELAVQGAHGVYSEQDLQQMAVEVDELLREMVAVANTRDGKGKAVFGGARSDNLPFQTATGNVPGAAKELITEVRYTGDIIRNMAEVAEGVHMPLNFPGNEVFWAENQQVFSTVDAAEYQVPANSVISLQGQEIELQEGDSVYAVMAKINDAGAGLRARLDPVQNSMVLETTSPQQLWVEDRNGGTVLQDLGIVGSPDDRPPHNLSPTAEVFGGSAFDMVINLRDTLLEGRSFEVGGAGLRGIDDAMNRMLGELGRLGAQSTRLEMGADKLSNDRLTVGEWNSRKVDLDMAEAITELKRLESTHRAALSTSARIMQTTLLDFLR